MTIKELIQICKPHLNDQEIFLALTYLTKKSKTDIIINSNVEVDNNITESMHNIIKKRQDGMPLSKIIGIKHFWKSAFITSIDVLDPRTDSETLIEAVLQHTNKNQNYRILDLGAGSGCLIISLLQELPNATGLALDISHKAIAIAKQNAKNLNVDNRLQFKINNWFNDIDLEDKLFDIVISNPPYVEKKDIFYLSKEVKNYDPLVSLDGGLDGLDSYRKIIPFSYKVLKKEGILALEHGYNQQNKVIDLCLNYFGSTYYKYNDPNNDRVLLFIK